MALSSSVACRDAANQCGHKLLCASGPSAAAWQRFRQHAREDAELPELDLAAVMLAALLSQPGGAAAVAVGLVQEPVAAVLRRDAAGAEAAAHTLRDVSTSCELQRAALLLSCKRAEVPASRVRALAQMHGLNSFGHLVGLFRIMF